MNEKQILNEIDAAIDSMDLEAIDRGLEQLSAVAEPVCAEDAMLFSARIKKMSEENSNMKKPRRTVKIAIIAAVVMAMGVTAYAAGAMNLFSFVSGDRFVTIRTTESMTEQEAIDFVGENAAARESSPEDYEAAGVIVATSEDFTFGSAEEAAKGLDMQIPLPAAMPDLPFESATGSRTDFGASESRTAWLNYGSVDGGRLFGVTVVREIIDQGETVTGYTEHDIDPGSLGVYKSKSGLEYTTLTESNPSGDLTIDIATTLVGEYEYTLVFLGFDEAERHAIIDSADLSPLK